MSEYTVVVTDTWRARFFTVENAKNPEVESGPKLVEQEALANPDPKLTANRRAGNGVSGRTRSPSGGSYAFDDHRTKHDLEALRRFVQKVAAKAVKRTQQQDARRCLVIAAEKKVLGVLRQALADIRTNGMEIRECDRDMAGETPAQIQTLLAKRKLIPAVKKPIRPSRGLRG